MTFYHPKYYAELRRLRKLQAASDKLQAEATSDKQQAQPEVASDKRQAASDSKNFSISISDKQQAS